MQRECVFLSARRWLDRGKGAPDASFPGGSALQKRLGVSAAPGASPSAPLSLHRLLSPGLLRLSLWLPGGGGPLGQEMRLYGFASRTAWQLGRVFWKHLLDERTRARLPVTTSSFRRDVDPSRLRAISEENPPAHLTQNIRPLRGTVCLRGLRKASRPSCTRPVPSPLPP